VNSWLRDNGFMALKEGKEVGGDFLQDVDWTNTRAYSVGFGGIYINQFGREKNGVVYKGAETEQVKKEIAEALSKLKDVNGAAVVKKVYTSAELYQGPHAGNGPDLFVGFDTYYRASWQSGLGAAPKKIIEDNDRLWGGDHLCDPRLVPGVLFSNLKLRGDQASLLDISPTILKYFGLSGGPDLEGKALN
jgi:predicted AlkP superfamily phosphohydrolase/phosphomutase